jgi:Protein of unknown function (DUF1549)/Protein of unknown function (DUF1553)
MMADRTSRGWRIGTLALGLLLAGSVLAGQEPAKPKTGKHAEPPKIPAMLAKSGDVDKIEMINKRIAEKWQENKLKPSERASDYEFIRRASLDIIGRIAKPEEIEVFLKDPPDTRRALLIDRLLSQKDNGHVEFARNLANLWTVLLMTRTGSIEDGTRVYHEQMQVWLEDAFAANKSWREIVTDLLTASGKTNENGAVNYILANLGEPNPRGSQEGRYNMVPLTSRTTRLFLGIQTQCTQCHDHPFNPGKQDAFWGINAFFRQVEPKNMNAMMMRGKEVVREVEDDMALNSSGIISFENRKGLVRATRPRFFDQGKIVNPTVNRRQALAQYVTGSPYFAKAFVNRTWQHFFGRGFTNPVDDFGDHNEPSHPELLDELAKEFTHYGFDVKRLVRWICNSEAYNLSAVANKTNESSETEPYFSRMLLKAMTPEQLFESLAVATRAELFAGEKRRELRQNWLKSLTVSFGDDEGNEASFNGTVVQALLMMNGKDLNDAISARASIPTVAVLGRRSPARIIEYFYLATLNRPPTGKEATRILDILRSAPVKSKDPLKVWQDVFWALLNSNEFILNH